MDERQVDFHPDDMFEDHVFCYEGINTFTPEECALNNRLMAESFKACDKDGVDIYKIEFEILRRAIG